MLASNASVPHDERDNTPLVLPIVPRLPAICQWCSQVDDGDTPPFCYLGPEPFAVHGLCAACLAQAMREYALGYPHILSEWIALRRRHLDAIRPPHNEGLILPFRVRRPDWR